MTPNRRASDQLNPQSAHFEGRMSSLETDVRNQGKVLGDFIQESRKTTGELFDGINRLSDSINGQRATNWQQLGVMLIGQRGGWFHLYGFRGATTSRPAESPGGHGTGPGGPDSTPRACPPE